LQTLLASTIYPSNPFLVDLFTNSDEQIKMKAGEILVKNEINGIAMLEQVKAENPERKEQLIDYLQSNQWA
jgi:hypothetical protein